MAAIDPVCKMRVDEKTTRIKSEYGETTYYFCNAQCKKTFDSNPQKYVSKGSGN